MTCEIVDREDGRWFICWNKKPKDKKVKCVACKRRWSTLLCDGVLPGPVREAEVQGKTYEQPEPVTCDAPLCEDCTTRPAPGVIALPDHREGDMNGVHVLQTERRIESRRRRRGPASKLRDDLPLPNPKPVHVDVPPDTKDFCPDCVRRMEHPTQADLFTTRKP